MIGKVRGNCGSVVMLLALLVSGCATDGMSAGPLSASGPGGQFAHAANRPPTPRTLLAYARVLAAQEKEGECLFVLKKLIQDYPRFMPAYNELAELHLRHRRFEDATAVLNGGLNRAPRDPVLLNNLGMCWMLRNEYAKALVLFTRAAGLAPGNARYRSNMAAALGMMGRDQEALALYEQVLPETEAQYNLTVLRRARQALTRNPDQAPRSGTPDLGRADGGDAAIPAPADSEAGETP
jgi:tetratricopeptide (TPR) repeat protein